MNYRISKAQYMMDFWVYPVCALPLLVLSLKSPWPVWLSLAALGLLCWTLAEYLIHRWLFHGRLPLASEHQAHHAKPADYIGLSGWYTLLIFLALFAALRLVIGQAAHALLLGFMAGYYLYITLHYCFHHQRVAPGSALFALKVRHVRHHVGGYENFGVTTPLWDKVFGTFR